MKRLITTAIHAACLSAVLLLTACDRYPHHSLTVNSSDALVETTYGTLCRR